MKQTGWGMIGCGDVTRMKSGPAFNKVANSFIAGVMSRDLEKARQYALENNIPDYYDDVQSLLLNPRVSAIYIATPPSSHETYALLAIAAGKDVYIEKPMAMNYDSAQRIASSAEIAGVKIVVAHYRREQPVFKKVKELLSTGVIGTPRLAVCTYQKMVQTKAELSVPGNKWRIDPAISGGGIFHDLAPHQLDLMLYFFGEYISANGLSKNQCECYNADDIVAGTMLFKEGVIFSGTWLFNASRYVDHVEITGTKGRLWFAAFQHEEMHVEVDGIYKTYTFDFLQHVQMPMIQEVVNYFQGISTNPCSPNNGTDVMKIMDTFTSKTLRLNS